MRGGAREGSGRPPNSANKVTAELKELAQTYTEQALTRLAFLMENALSEQAQVAACKEILDRGHGKAKQETEHSGKIDLGHEEWIRQLK